ncbi:hypothetical protein [Acinetobacter sp. ANC 5502]
MKQIPFGLGVIFTLSLSACTVYTPEGSVVVDPDHASYGGGYGDDGDRGNFCPPGQAKKGRC